MGGIIKKQPRDRGESHRFPEPRTGSITMEGHCGTVSQSQVHQKPLREFQMNIQTKKGTTG